MRIELDSIPTDTAPLDGLYYEPEARVAGINAVRNNGTDTSGTITPQATM